MTPALNSISPVSAGGPPKDSTRSAASERAQPPEKFRAVIERLLQFFSTPSQPDNTRSGPTDSPDAPARKKDKADKSGVDEPNHGNPPIPQSKPDLTTTPDAWTPLPLQNVTLEANGLAASVASCFFAGRIGNATADLPANPKIESPGVVALDSKRGKPTAGPVPAAIVPTRNDSVKRRSGTLHSFDDPVAAAAGDTVLPAATGAQKGRSLGSHNQSVTPGSRDGASPPLPSAVPPFQTMKILRDADGNPAGFEPAELPSPARQNQAACDSNDLPKALAQSANGTSGSLPVQTANQPPPAKPAAGVASAPSENFSKETVVSAPGETTPKPHEQPAVASFASSIRSESMPVPNPPHRDNGTAVAQQETTMKMAAKQTNFSGAKQKLPASATGSATTAPVAGENLPLRPAHGAASAPIRLHVEPAMPSGTGTPAISSSNGAGKIVPVEILDLPHTAPTCPPYVERAREMISLQVMHVQEAGADEMRVVIKPDLGLQLSLHLHRHGDAVEVQAVLDRGNFGLLNRHWPELQQQLELRGVRVAPLANADSSLGGGSAGFRQPTPSHGQHAGDDAEADEMPPALFSGLPPATATASASRISSRHLEIWA